MDQTPRYNRLEVLPCKPYFDNKRDERDGAHKFAPLKGHMHESYSNKVSFIRFRDIDNWRAAFNMARRF